jgi:hypothetical protein
MLPQELSGFQTLILCRLPVSNLLKLFPVTTFLNDVRNPLASSGSPPGDIPQRI